MDASLVCIPLCLSIATLEILGSVMRITNFSTQDGRNDIRSKFKSRTFPRQEH